jgi:hypothetical protein
MSAFPSLSGVQTALAPAPAPAKPRARGFLHIVRYGAGPGSVYVLTYHRLESTPPEHPVGARLAVPVLDAADPQQAAGVLLSAAKDPSSIDPLGDAPSREPACSPEPPRPVLAESAQALIDLLERLGVDFHRAEVRGALEDILRLGSANIPDLWLSDDELLARGLAES